MSEADFTISQEKFSCSIAKHTFPIAKVLANIHANILNTEGNLLCLVVNHVPEDDPALLDFLIEIQAFKKNFEAYLDNSLDIVEFEKASTD
ncbi:MAG: hypothetical protein ABL903_19275 [Methylococcales bacterium]